MTMRSAAVAAASDACSERGGVSITARSTPPSRALCNALGNRAGCASIMMGVSALRRSPHLQAVACGSRSMTTAVLPDCCAATARDRARVVFPVPPFCAIRAIVFMAISQQAYLVDWHRGELTNSLQLCLCLGGKSTAASGDAQNDLSLQASYRLPFANLINRERMSMQQIHKLGRYAGTHYLSI